MGNVRSNPTRICEKERIIIKFRLKYIHRFLFLHSIETSRNKRTCLNAFWRVQLLPFANENECGSLNGSNKKGCRRISKIGSFLETKCNFIDSCWQLFIRGKKAQKNLNILWVSCENSLNSRGSSYSYYHLSSHSCFYFYP